MACVAVASRSKGRPDIFQIWPRINFFLPLEMKKQINKFIFFFQKTMISEINEISLGDLIYKKMKYKKL